MKTAIYYITKDGEKLAGKLAVFLNGAVFEPYNLIASIRENFHKYNAFILIMASGIAVRAIAPVILNKSKDPAVVVLDDGGNFAISLLSGHLGGANELAKKVADFIGATAVITTATDNKNKIAFDMVAKYNDCAIENIEILKKISASLLNEKQIGLFSSYEITKIPKDICLNKKKEYNVIITNKQIKKSQYSSCLILHPRNIVVGIGCKKGKSKEQISAFLFDFLKQNHISFHSVKCFASVEQKKEEKGILEFCSEYNINFMTFSPQYLSQFESEFECSDFVKKTVGTGSVSEASAVYALPNTRLLCKKMSYHGITLALGECDTKINMSHEK